MNWLSMIVDVPLRMAHTTRRVETCAHDGVPTVLAVRGGDELFITSAGSPKGGYTCCIWLGFARNLRRKLFIWRRSVAR